MTMSRANLHLSPTSRNGSYSGSAEDERAMACDALLHTPTVPTTNCKYYFLGITILLLVAIYIITDDTAIQLG